MAGYPPGDRVARARHCWGVMDPSTSQIHSFVVKTWTDPEEPGVSSVRWHGQITHVETGRQRSVRELHQVTGFIASYLEAMGVDLGLRWRIARWLRGHRAEARR